MKAERILEASLSPEGYWELSSVETCFGSGASIFSGSIVPAIGVDSEPLVSTWEISDEQGEPLLSS